MAARHLCSLDGLRGKLALLEAQAGLLSDEWEATTSDNGCSSPLIKAVHSAPPPPRPRSPSLAAAGVISDLKAHLEAVLDADRAGDDLMSSITQQHCIACAVRVIQDAEDGSLEDGSAARSALELASSALCTLSQRPPTHELLLSAGAVPALVSLLAPGAYPTCATTNAASALGNLAADPAGRRAARCHGAVGALVRLLRGDAPGAAQAAAASALCLMAARDPVVQDSVRYLGGVDLLVELLTSPKSGVAEVARYCLASLKHNNPRNEADILQAVRMSPVLSRDFGRLRDALELLQRGREPEGRGYFCAAVEAEERARLRRAAEAEEEEEARHSRAAARALIADARSQSAAALELQLARASATAAAAAARAASAGRARPLSASAAAATAAAAVATAAAATAAEAACVIAAGDGGCHALGLPGRSAKSPLGKHLVQFTSDELCALLSELGWEPSDLRGLRRAGTTGGELLLRLAAAAASDPACSELAARLRVPPHKARRGLRRLRDAVALFDAAGTRAAQPRLSEIEVRLWLAGSGCSASEVERVVKLIWGLVVGNKDAAFITCWEWVLGWQWVTHALEVYGVDWRSAL